MNSNFMQFLTKKKKMKKISLALLAVSLVFLSWKTINKRETKPEFSPQSLMKTIKDSGIVFPDIVWSQSAIETGYWKSKIFNENNNLFGMKMPRVRQHTAIGTKNGHAAYEDWLQSVSDYKLWQKNLRIDSTTTRDTYYKILSRVYCTTRGYVKYVKKLLPRAKDIENSLDSLINDIKIEL